MDVLNASYLREIERLQDCVPPFEDALAWDMIIEGGCTRQHARFAPQCVALAADSTTSCACVWQLCLETHWPCCRRAVAAFGKPVSSVFGELSPAPIAAASLGQVSLMHTSNL